MDESIVNMLFIGDSVAYLIQADENEPLVVKPDENSGVQWIPIEEFFGF